MNDFEELNNIEVSKPRSIPYEEYFGEMDLSDEQKEKRISFAEQMDDVMLFIFALFTVYRSYEMEPSYSFIVNELIDEYKSVAGNYTEIDKHLNDYIEEFSNNIVDTTIKNQSDPYYMSDDRASYVAENEANTTLNYAEFQDALHSGKTQKEWVDMRDRRERKSHLKVGGTKIPIRDAFVVGNSLMMFPKDDSLGAEASEIINCRCSVKYT